MSDANDSARRSGISAQLFELLKVVFTLVLTGVIGGGITYYYQNRSHREQQESQELESARQSALTFLREVGDILEQRRQRAFSVLYSVRDNSSSQEKEQVWKDYMGAVNAWNMKWNLYRALVLEQFGPEMQKRFYDEKADAEGVWEKCSITGKLIIFHNMLTEFQKQTPDKPALDPKQIEQHYSSIAQDCYAFYAEVIARIQEGRVGKRSWSAAGKNAD
ncbi:MAG: hypothetical protein QOG67_825 [Verrucomicrobiota bacterium]|jgi:hypothetical protein